MRSWKRGRHRPKTLGGVLRKAASRCIILWNSKAARRVAPVHPRNENAVAQVRDREGGGKYLKRRSKWRPPDLPENVVFSLKLKSAWAFLWRKTVPSCKGTGSRRSRHFLSSGRILYAKTSTFCSRLCSRGVSDSRGAGPIRSSSCSLLCGKGSYLVSLSV